MNSFLSHQINEAVALSPAQLDKPNSSTGESRADILIRLVKGGKPIELAKGGTVTIENTPELISQIEKWRDDDSDKKSPIPMLTVDGQAITTSKLAKSKVFGGGTGGAGGGTENTKITESHQCVLLQAMLDYGTHDVDYYTPEILTKAYKKVFVDASIKEILSVDDTWFVSSYKSALYLVKNKYVNKNHTFHRNDKVMNGIYALKSAAFKNSGFPNLKDDKWNPGDIWAVEKGFKLKELPSDSVKSLNEKILELFATRRLVGISLKQIKSKKADAKGKEYNVKRPPDTDDHRVFKVLLQGEQRGTFWSSKGSTIQFDKGQGALNLKDNSPGAAVKAEIKGKSARGGGASWGVMQDAARQVFRKKIPDHKAGVFKIAKKIKRGDKKAVNVMWTLFNHFYRDVSREEFEKELALKDFNWISAKLGSLYICYYVSINTGPKANRFITKIVNYAGSKSEDSSAYIKVYE